MNHRGLRSISTSSVLSSVFYQPSCTFIILVSSLVGAFCLYHTVLTASMRAVLEQAEYQANSAAQILRDVHDGISSATPGAFIAKESRAAIGCGGVTYFTLLHLLRSLVRVHNGMI